MHKEHIGSTEFTFRRIDSPDLLKKIFQLRFEVYCHECKFIKDWDCPSGQEKDKYDSHSIHFVAEDKNGIIGTARLVLDSSLGFPLEERYNGKLTFDKESLPREKTGEISRLVISKTYRRRKGDGLYYSPDFHDMVAIMPGEEGLVRRIRPMAFGLYREIYQESKRRGITHWYAMMEKSLWLLLRIHNFIFYPIGEEIDYYGPVRPYLGVIEEIEQGVSKRFPGTFEYFRAGLEPEYQPKLP